MNTATPEHTPTPTFDTLHAVGGMADAVTPKPSNRANTITFKPPAPSTKPPPTPSRGRAGARGRGHSRTPYASPPGSATPLGSPPRTPRPKPPSVRDLMNGVGTPSARCRADNTDTIARFFRARSARIDSPIFADKPHDFACTNPEVRFCAEYREHAWVPANIPPRELLALHYGTQTERVHQVNVGSAVARNPVAYSIRVDFDADAEVLPLYAKLAVRPDSVNHMFVLARPEYTEEEQAAMQDEEVEAFNRGKAPPPPLDKWFWTHPAEELGRVDDDMLGMDEYNADHMELKFWAAPCRKELRGEATVVLIVQNTAGEEWFVDIHLSAMGCEPHMRVVGEQVKTVFGDPGSYKMTFNDTGHQQLHIKNDCPQGSSLLLSVLLVEDGIYRGSRPPAFEMVHVEEQKITGEVVKLLKAGDSLPLLVNFDVPPDSPIPICYHAYLQVRIAYFLQSHYNCTADEELPHYYDHVVYIEAPRADGTPLAVPTPTPSVTPSSTPVKSFLSTTRSVRSAVSETFPDKLDFNVDEHSESIFGEETTVEIYDAPAASPVVRCVDNVLLADAEDEPASPAVRRVDIVLLADVEDDDLVPEDEDCAEDSNYEKSDEKPSEEVEDVKGVSSEFEISGDNEQVDVDKVLDEERQESFDTPDSVTDDDHRDDTAADSFNRELGKLYDDEDDEDDYEQSEVGEEDGVEEIKQLDGVVQELEGEKDGLDEAVDIQAEEYMKYATSGLNSTTADEDDAPQWKHNSPTDITVPVNHPPEPVKLRMPRSIRERGIVLCADSNYVSLVLQNASSHEVEISVDVRSDLEASLKVDRPDRVVKPHANCKFRLLRKSPAEALGEIVVYASCLDDAISVPGRKYALAVAVEDATSLGKPRRRARPERMIMDRPTLTFYRDAGACTLRVSNCGDMDGRIGAELTDVEETQTQQTEDSYAYSPRNPFSCETPPHRMLKRNYMTEFAVSFAPEGYTQRAAHYTATLRLDADGVHDAVPIFAYSGAAAMRCSVTRKGRVQIKNTGTRAGFALARGDSDERTAAVIAPQKVHVIDVPRGWDGQLHVGDEIARSRMRHAAGVHVTLERELAPYVDFLQPFDGDAAARAAERLHWGGINPFALHYATRLFGATLQVQQLAEQRFASLVQDERDMWDAWYEDDTHVRIINRSAKSDLKYKCTGGDPLNGTVPVLGDGLVSTDMSFIVLTARDREATISRE